MVHCTPQYKEACPETTGILPMFAYREIPVQPQIEVHFPFQKGSSLGDIASNTHVSPQ